MTTSTPTNGTELMRVFFPNSPFIQKLGLELDEVDDGRAAVRLPWSEENTTVGDMVHGGAIAALVDVTVMATAWGGAELPEKFRGVTVSMATEFVDAARAEDIVGRGEIVRRGRTLTTVDVTIVGADERVVAKALATYKVG
jgi:uncharacterized protein (TIGR00369 family)